MSKKYGMLQISRKVQMLLLFFLYCFIKYKHESEMRFESIQDQSQNISTFLIQTGKNDNNLTS